MTSAGSPVYAFQKNPTMVDYPGHLAAIYFVSGCNFRCGFCHNAALMAVRTTGMPWDQVEASCKQFKRNWVDAVVITGGEPTLSPELPDLVRLFKGHGFIVKLDTNGSRPDMLRSLLTEVDYVAMDIKCGPERYPGLTGFSDTAKLTESIGLIKTGDREYEFRTTVIDPIHTDEEMAAIGEWIRGARRYALQPFVPREDLPDIGLRTTPRTSAERMKQLQSLMQSYADEVLCRE